MSFQFVVLHHQQIAQPHFDLMFETAPDSLLTTWRSEHWPIDRPMPITRIGDHRRAYLTFEGELSGQRGHVKRIVSGTCAIDRHDDDSFWSIQFFNPAIVPLNIRRVNGDEWFAVPACGG